MTHHQICMKKSVNLYEAKRELYNIKKFFEGQIIDFDDVFKTLKTKHIRLFISVINETNREFLEEPKSFAILSFSSKNEEAENKKLTPSPYETDEYKKKFCSKTNFTD